MYLDYYQLREYPFTLASDPRFLYFSDGHKEAMAGLLYSLRERKGVGLLLGEPGTGKTTVLAAVLEMLPGGVHAQSLDSPLHATPEAVLAAIVRGFGLAGGDGLSANLAVLQGYLRERHAAGECVLLIIDEAQDLNPMALEQVRLLTNLERQGHKLLQIILSGQPELAEHLRLTNGRALHQRVAVRCQLEALSGPEVQAYLSARLERAGAQRGLFEAPAVDRIHQLSAGVPRVINVIADHCLLAGFAAQAPRVNRALVDRVAVKLEIQPAPMAAVPAPAPAATGAAVPPAAPPPAPVPVPGRGSRLPGVLQRFASGCARYAGFAPSGD
ncbi:MAG TPA: AAA family ATPase [Terriglobales bacterium]|nr:AAA family ATPase [Terriglobales bacterium]